MKTNISALVVGLIFALGLGISGMTQPAKVVGFLDLFGNWDPSLAFVMMGAIGIHLPLYWLIRRRRTPVFADKWQVPEQQKVTAAIAVGAVIFGIGWGLGGFCPGPAVVSLASLETRPVIFVASMIAGMLLSRVFKRARG